MPARGHTSPIPIAILALLTEEPMHAYRMQQLIRERGTDLVVNVQHRSNLHAALDRLVRDGHVAVQAVERTTRHPERTIYALTPAGHEALLTAVRDGLAKPATEYPLFPAAISFLHVLAPDEVVRMLNSRADVLRQRLTSIDAVLTASHEQHVPAAYLLEHDYRRAITSTELDWITATARDLTNGNLRWQPTT